MVLVAKQVKRRRGTTAENDAFTGAEGEITVDLTKKTLRVHDGSTQGGTELARMSDIGSGIDKAISNCITNIPQDIKLELNAGTLTLKAGSKVYVPNGAGVFDEVVIASDLSDSTTTSDTNERLVCYRRSDNTLKVYTTFQSGTTPPSTGTNIIFYNTTDNTIKRYTNGSVVDSEYSLPVGVVKADGTYISGSIQQVFNGFGYIGLTVFALPGVKGLIPDGRNADGSLKNTEFITGHVSTVTNTSNLTTDLWYSINANGNIANSLTNYWKYDEQKNIWVHGDVLWTDIPFARSYANGGKVENFVSKNVFHALDYNDSEYIAHQAMPSDRYVDLTAPAHGGSLTAPADGWFTVRGWASSGAYVWLRNENNGLGQTAPTGDQYSISYCSVPVKKGDIISVGYYGGTLTMCRFVYANGAQ